jgi:hypothetical protein
VIDRINGVDPKDAQFVSTFPLAAAQLPPPGSKAGFEVLGPDLIQFGSDRFLPSGEHIRAVIDEVNSLFDDLEWTQLAAKIFSGTAATWLGLNCRWSTANTLLVGAGRTSSGCQIRLRGALSKNEDSIVSAGFLMVTIAG